MHAQHRELHLGAGPRDRASPSSAATPRTSSNDASESAKAPASPRRCAVAEQVLHPRDGIGRELGRGREEAGRRPRVTAGERPRSRLREEHRRVIAHAPPLLVEPSELSPQLPGLLQVIGDDLRLLREPVAEMRPPASPHTACAGPRACASGSTGTRRRARGDGGSGTPPRRGDRRGSYGSVHAAAADRETSRGRRAPPRRRARPCAPRWNTSPSTEARSITTRSRAGSPSSRARSSASRPGGISDQTEPPPSTNETSSSRNSGLPPATREQPLQLHRVERPPAEKPTGELGRVCPVERARAARRPRCSSAAASSSSGRASPSTRIGARPRSCQRLQQVGERRLGPLEVVHQHDDRLLSPRSTRSSRRAARAIWLAEATPSASPSSCSSGGSTSAASSSVLTAAARQALASSRSWSATMPAAWRSRCTSGW